MKAITCSQCGALITKISTKAGFVSCDYCRAKIPIKIENVLEIPALPKTIEHKNNTWKLNEKEKQLVFSSVVKSDEPVTNYTDEQKTGVIIILGILLIIGLPILLYNVLSDPEKQYLDFEIDSTITYDIVEKPWFEKVGYAKIRRKDLNAETIKNLKSIPFDERKVEVEVNINDEGNVEKAKIISGREPLGKYALDVAYKTTFQKITLNETKHKIYTYHFEYD